MPSREVLSRLGNMTNVAMKTKILIIPLTVLLFSSSLYLSSSIKGPAQRRAPFIALTDTLPSAFGFGRVATQTEIDLIDIDIRPDGQGLPPGKGMARRGKKIYDLKCIACHGAEGSGGIGGTLVSSNDTRNKRPQKTIGNYWPYSTTIFDYIRRAMPQNAPGSLTDEEVYHLTAYLLHANGIISQDFVINAQTLPQVNMPARNLFINDDRQGGPEIR